jgi:hypothetical protein
MTTPWNNPAVELLEQATKEVREEINKYYTGKLEAVKNRFPDFAPINLSGLDGPQTARTIRDYIRENAQGHLINWLITNSEDEKSCLSAMCAMDSIISRAMED